MGLRNLWQRSGGGAESAAKEPEAVLEQAHQLRRMGRLEDARQQVATALAGAVDHPDLNRFYWDLCVQMERPELAATQLLRAVRAQLRAGRGEDAVFGWFELLDRLTEPPTLDLDTRWRLAEAMLGGGHDEAAAELVEDVEQQLDASVPLAMLLRLASVAAKSRSPSAESLVADALGRPGVPESIRGQLEQELAAAREAGLRRPSGEVHEDGPIEVSRTVIAERRLKVAAAIPRAVDGERLTLVFPNGQERGLAVRQIQAVSAVRIDDGSGEAYVLIDLLLDSLWSDLEGLRTVRLRSRDFDPQALVPDAADAHLALGMFLSNLLASSQAQPLPDAEAAVGRPFHAFASIAEYQRRVLDIT